MSSYFVGHPMSRHIVTQHLHRAAAQSRINHYYHWQQRHMSLLLALQNAPTPPPEVTVKALLEFSAPTAEGRLVQAVAIPWFRIAEMIQRDPEAMYRIKWETWEEIIAGAYDLAGFDEVLLTPRSGDYGRDVVATKNGIGSIRIFDQVKAYKPGNVVTAEEVRAMLGVITAARNVSKGVITTTSSFAPRLMDDPSIAAYIPHRLELKPRDALLPWLEQLPGQWPERD